MSYIKTLLTARQEADRRLSEKGLASKPRVLVEDADPEMLSGKPLVSRPTTSEEPREGFMTEYYNKLYAQNQELKNQVVGKLRTDEELGPLAKEKDFQSKLDDLQGQFPKLTNGNGEEVGVRLKQDIQEIFGLEDHQAAGIVGNLDHETLNFKFLQEIKPVVKGSRGGYGIAMWTGDRRKAYEKWSEENGLDPSSYEANLGYLVHEFQTDNYFKKIMGRLEKTTTVDEATRVFSDGYLKPGIPKMDSRLKRSRVYVGK